MQEKESETPLFKIHDFLLLKSKHAVRLVVNRIFHLSTLKTKKVVRLLKTHKLDKDGSQDTTPSVTWTLDACVCVCHLDMWNFR